MAKKRSDADEQSFSAASRAAEASPSSDDAWEHLEDLAERLERPEEVAEIYRRLLGGELPPETRRRVAERAVQFHEEWFGDTPEAITELLGSIMERDPEAAWAFDRLVVTLTSAERWDPLLAVYDRRLAVTRDPELRKQLLDDAAGVAKDFADQPERAADYLRQLLVLDPDNDKRVAALERLYERQERFGDLIELWRTRAERLDPAQARELRVRTATLLLDRIGDAEQALGELERIVDEAPGHLDACTQLERVLGLESAPAGTRRRALSLLRRNYQAAERPDDVVRVLTLALAFLDPDDRPGVHREIGNRLAARGRDEEAIGHYAELLRASPSDPDARKQLRQLARKSERHDLHAAALLGAAEVAGDPGQQIALVLDAAYVHREALDDHERAIELLRRVLDAEDAEPSSALAAAHSLNEMLAGEQRADERLAVLERLARLERASAVRRSILGEAARLAAELGQLDRALADWNHRLDADPTDLEALDAVVSVLQTSGRWTELIAALRRRADASTRAQQRRADLVRVAEIQKDELEDVGGAIDTWLAVRSEFGDAVDMVAALDGLMATAMRWAELAAVLEQTAGSGRDGAARSLARLGDIRRVHLDDAVGAARAYADALGVHPGNVAAREGLRALLEDHAASAAAAETLATAYRITGDIDGLLEILEPRLAAQTAARARVAVLREAAELHEERHGDRSAALAAMARALPLDPADLALEHALVRLAGETDQWADAATALEAAARAAAAVPARAAQLFDGAATIREHRLGDPAGAAADHAAAEQADPGRAATLEALTRTAAAAADWGAATRAMVALTRGRDRLPTTALGELEARAESEGAWRDLIAATEASLRDAVPRLRGELARDLEARVADWYLAHTDELDAAEAALARALEHDAADPANLGRLAQLQRRRPGPGLVETLGKIDALSATDLDPLFEAASVAIEHAKDPQLGRSIVERLYRKSSALWIHGQRASGTQGAPTACTWAIERLLAMYGAAGETERVAQLLLDGSRLPVEPARSRALRLEAAETLAQQGQRSRAIELYRGVLEEAPDDAEILARIAALCQQEGRVSELLALRLRELELSRDPARRLELRLELSRLSGELEARGGRVEALRANLAERPGHAESLEALANILEDRGRFTELVDMLEQQARGIEAAEAERAAALWGRAAALSATRLGDVPRAIADHGRVVELAANDESLDALARLELDRDRPAAAATWLERRLETAKPKARVAVLLQLARAHVRADNPDAAVSALRSAFDEAPRNAEVRKLLLGLYRQREDFAALARTLAIASENVADEETVLAYATEAAELFYGRLKEPEKAVPVLEKALRITPDDRTLKSMLADGLRVAGRLDEAKTLLTDLIEGFGRRRSAERAGMHLALAQVVRAQGDIDAAIEQLDQAAKMDAGNLRVLQTLAELARQSGQLERAERAYRTLLLNVRRSHEDSALGQSAILYALSSIARDRDQADQAEELFESAIDALAQNDDEADALQAALRERGELDLLRRVLETRLQHVHVPHRRADIFAQLAGLLETNLDDPEAALEARLAAIGIDPGSPPHHDAAQELATRLGAADRYVGAVESLLENARRDADAYVRCELLLRLAAAIEATDLPRASDLVSQAEQTGVRQVDVWRAGARVAAARGDAETQMLLLGRLAELGADQAETRADALYRLAEVQLSSPETLDVGLVTLGKALSDDPRYERAGVILRRASDVHEHNGALLDLYELAARRSGDDAMLLHYLERRAAHPEAGAAVTREGVDLALRLDQAERAERLMLRAVEIGEGLIDGLGQVAWALLGLAQRRMAGGDTAGAVKWLGQAAEVADLPPVLALAADVTAATRGPDGDPSLAIKLYEKLVERDATVRAAWEPLADLYIATRQPARLERLVEETLDGLQDAADRNALRVKLAEVLLADGDRTEGAVAALRDVLLEDPQHDRAQALLADHLERTGKSKELLDLLRGQWMAAQNGGDVPAIKATSIRLAQRLAPSDPSEAESVYRTALHAAPGDSDLLAALLGHLGPDHDAAERAELLERLVLVAPEDGAARLGRELVALREALGDEAGALRALEATYARAPTDLELRTRLEARYRERGDFSGLARMLAIASEEAADPRVRVRLLREAAVVHRDLLHDAGTAAGLLRRATELSPDDPGLRLETAHTLQAAGDFAAALAIVGEVLAATAEGDPVRAEILATRAKIRAATGDEAGATEDLEAAFALAPAAAAAGLVETLSARRRRAQDAADQDGEREVTMRLCDVLVAADRRSEARELLHEWTERARRDVDALARLRALASDEGHWETVAAVCERLVALENGPAQIDAALGLSRAHRELGRPAEARAGLEHARRKQPENRALRDELRAIYEASGADAELARLLVEDARELTDTDQRLDRLRQAGQLLIGIGEGAAAIDVLGEILTLAPGDAYATAVLADAYLSEGRLDEADRLLDDAIVATKNKRSPELSQFQHRKARVAEARGDTAAHLEALQQAFATDKRNGLAAAELADLAEHIEDFDLAIKTLRSIAMMEGGCPITRGQAFLRQGRIALRQGDPKRAALWARRARQEEPESAEITAFLDQLGG
jgi:tetratricopeptide (TPR) repeat protein